MAKNIANIRREYTKATLNVNDTASDPIQQFKKWFEEAQKAEVMEVNAMNLCTVSADGKPSSRIVLIKEISERGFVFFTNYESKKGHDLEKNPYAAITFFWPELERQVRIEGKVEKVKPEVSDTYFATRPRGSQIGAWASPQSQEIPNRGTIEINQKNYDERFANKEVPRPAHWGGYELIPDSVEFWQGRASRLHDRVLYEKSATGWAKKILAP